MLPPTPHAPGSVLRALGVAAAAAVLLVLGLVPAHAQDFDARIDELKSERRQVQRLTDVASADLDDIRDRIDELHTSVRRARTRSAAMEQQVDRLEARATSAGGDLRELQAEVDGTRRQLRSRAAAMYMSGRTPPALELLGSQSLGDGLKKASWVELLAVADQDQINEAMAQRAELDATVEAMHFVRSELVSVQRELAELTERLDADLAEAEVLESELEARVGTLTTREEQVRADLAAARDARLQQNTGSHSASPGSAPSGSGGRACPMHSIPQLFNDWGWPRGGGTRSHQGNDLYGDPGEPVYAMASGIWDIQSYGNNAGYWGILRGDDGLEYWYMHLERHVVGDGTRVGVGQQVATNGWSGNAVGGVYHVHFEIHPGGGGAVDPYPYLVAVC